MLLVGAVVEVVEDLVLETLPLELPMVETLPIMAPVVVVVGLIAL